MRWEARPELTDRVGLLIKISSLLLQQASQREHAQLACEVLTRGGHCVLEERVHHMDGHADPNRE
jgi:hypothetical protein